MEHNKVESEKYQCVKHIISRHYPIVTERGFPHNWGDGLAKADLHYISVH
jgi:hypothetical protein